MALRRLRAELDAQFQGISELSSTLSSVEAEQRAAEQARRAALPASVGLPSTVEAVGWHGRRAMVLHVEGAAAGAPLRPRDKPLPQGDWFVARRAGAPSTLNPISGADGEAAILTAPAIGRLLAVDPDAPPSVVPSLATGWEMDAETLRCTYHLRRGVQFADGRPFTSADVLFSLDVVRDPALHADRLRSTLDVVASLEAHDAFTVVATFRERNWRAPFLLGTTLRILNKGWYEEEMPAWAHRLGLRDSLLVPGAPGFAAVFNAIRIPCPGTGPYYFAGEDMPLGQPVDLVRNPFSWAMQVQPERHCFDGLRWIAVADDAVALERLKKAQIDSLVIDLATWDDTLRKDIALAAVATVHEYDHSGLGALAIIWNCRRPPFDDARVRRAMTLTFDREALVRDEGRGRGVVPSGPAKSTDPQVPPGSAAWPHDEAAARQSLAEAGWSDTNADGWIDRAGKPFEATLLVGSAHAPQAAVARRLAAACKMIGVNLKISSVDSATFRGHLDERTFDAALVDTARPDPWYDPHDDFHSSQAAPGGGNIAGWHDATVDALLDAMRLEFDGAKRREDFARFQSIFHGQQPWTMLLEGRVGVLINSRIEGVKVRPTGIQTFDMHVAPERVLRH